VRQFQFVIAIALAALIAGFMTWQMVYRSAYRELVEIQRADLVLARQSLGSEIERFRNLPRVLRHDERLRALVDDPGAPGRAGLVNRFLATIRDQTRADELFLLDDTGLTIAASNHDTPTTFVGQNYRFRPYFRDAVETGSGQFYAVGATTGRPGYFLSSRIDGEHETGVIVVKVDMTTFAASWRDNAPGTALMDRDGVVFLAGDPDWQYRPFTDLSDEARSRIETSRKYAGIDLQDAAPLYSPGLKREALDEGQVVTGDTILSLLPVGENGWTLIGRASLAPVTRVALTGSVLAGAAALLLAGALVIMRQRQSILRMKLDRNAELEAKVAERTAALAQEIEDRKRAEEELRDAQESLVQSAKARRARPHVGGHRARGVPAARRHGHDARHRRPAHEIRRHGPHGLRPRPCPRDGPAHAAHGQAPEDLRQARCRQADRRRHPVLHRWRGRARRTAPQGRGRRNRRRCAGARNLACAPARCASNRSSSTC
jgi:two-component system C4-dicarboxylate transport sensor histidine kinase DctB